MQTLLLPILLVLGFAQTPALVSATSPPPQKTTEALVYRLGPDDEIEIKVLNFENLSSIVTVPPDGNVVLPLLDSFQVTGMSVDELKLLLIEKWRKFVVNPSVYVTLRSKRKENILFYGFVSRVGTVEYHTDLHLIEALAQAGGALPSGDLSGVVLTHRDGTRQVLNLTHPEQKGGTAIDVLLQPTDVVFVPERRDEVSVLGEVGKPGSITYKDDMTVLNALTAAGNVHEETADLTAATLIHNGQETTLNLDAMLRHGDLSENIKLSPGDRIMVPEIRNRVYVYGDVGNPGYYSYKSGDRLLDALKSAGGPRNDANLRKINLIRIDRAQNKANLMVVNIDNLLKKGNMTGNVAMQPGDILYIPNNKRAFGWQDVVGIMSGLTIASGLSNVLH